MPELDVAAYRSQVFGDGQSNLQTPNPTPDDKTPTPTPDVPTPDPIVTSVVPDTPTPDTPVVPPTPNELKDNLGFEDWDSAKTAIAELKQKAETPAEIKFANEQSEIILKALIAGDTDPLYEHLSAQKRLSEVDKLSADEVLKLHIKETNKHYKKEDVADVFEEKYSYPEKPVQGDTEENPEYNARVSKWEDAKAKIDRRKERDAVTAKESLSKLKTELVFPTIKLSPEDEAFENFKNQKDALAQIRELDKKEYAKLSSKDVKMLFKFNDEANKLAFDIEYEPEKEGFDKAIADASDLSVFFGDYYDKDGNPNRIELAKAVYVARNVQKIVSEAVVQAVNAERARFLKAQKNISDNGQRNYVNPPQTDIDKLKEQVFGKTG